MNRPFFLQVFLGLVVLFANLAVAEDAEIKLLISDADRGAAKQEFKLSVKAPAERRVCFFDTNDGLLDAKGLIIRARLDQKENSKGELESDLVVKLRGNEPPAGYDKLDAGNNREQTTFFDYTLDEEIRGSSPCPAVPV